MLQLLFDAVCAVLMAMIPYFNKVLFDKILSNRYPMKMFIQVIILYLLCILLHWIFSYLISICIWKGAIRFETELKKDFFSAVIKLPYSKFHSKTVGEYLSIQGNDIVALEQDYLEPILDIIKSSNMLMIYGIIIWNLLGTNITMLILGLSILAILVPKITAKTLARYQNEYLKENGSYVNVMKQFLEGFSLINARTFVAINRRHHNKIEQVAKKRYRYGRMKTLTLTTSGTAVNVISFLLFILIGLLLIKGSMTVGTAVAGFGYLQCFIEPIESILYDISAIHSVKDIKKKILEMIQTKEHDNKKQIHSIERIEMKNIDYKNQKFELKNIQCTFERGKKYAIIGGNGSGKTTLLKLLLNYIESDKGEILFIENINLIHRICEGERKVDLSSVIYYMEQQSILFDDTIENNLSIYGTYQKEQWEKGVDLLPKKKWEEIKNRPSGLALSGGEKQLLAIARMIASDSQVYIMDEPFSAMDKKTADYMQQKLLQLEDKMVIMITHKTDEDSLALFDHVYEMRDGSLYEWK